MKETDQDKGDLLSGATASSAANPALANRPADSAVTKSDVSEQVDTTRQQLLELQRKREELEREKNELEELRRKQDEYDAGRKEMLERLSRSLVLLEHEKVEVERRSENVVNALASFKAVKEQIDSIRDDLWNNANLKEELTKALAVIDTARNEFNHYRARLDVLDEKRNPEAAAVTGPLAEFVPGEKGLSRLGFADLVKMGLAFSLPLIIALGLILLIILSRK